jgi:ferredoxin-NADP reductase
MPIKFLPPIKGTAVLEDKVVLNDAFTHFMFEMRSPYALPFLSGQYVSIKVSEKGERRAYSICSSPAIDHGFELLVDLSPNGVGANFLKNLTFGQEVEVMGPLGRFVLAQEDYAKQEPNLVFVATGSGVAPFYSMIQDLLQVKKDTRPIILYWGMRHDHQLFWTLEFQKLAQDFPNFSFHPVISRPSESWSLCQGRVTDCMNTHGILNPAGYYLCGNRAMIEEMSEMLQNAGISQDRIHHEKFF